MTVHAVEENSLDSIPEDQINKAPPLQAQRGMPGAENPVEIIAEPDSDTVLTSVVPRELVISANTRESRIASYLDSWKRKVERVGTINFPDEIRQLDVTGNPTLEVAISSDGSLEAVVVLSSSGERRLDQAAMDILRLAAPFDPFPEFLTDDYDVLRFAYEWRFSGPSTVRASANLAGDS